MDQFWLTEYFGAEWAHVDFHLHTPGSLTFKCPMGLDRNNSEHKNKIIAQYIDQLVKTGIRIAAITDYNGIRAEWFTPIQEEARKNNILIFPGAELSFNAGKHGLHIIAVFPLDANLEAINRTIHSLDKNPAIDLISKEGIVREIDVEKNVEDTLLKLRDQFASCIIAISHPNDSKGLFTTFGMKQAAKFLNEVHPDAIEGLDSKDIDRLRSTAELNEDYLERLVSVEFSDPKRIEEIGSKARSDETKRATYLKICEIKDLITLRSAFRDPHVRVCIGDAPNQSHTKLLAIEIEGSGFLSGVRLSFSPELNALIGGRGVGKSAILEVIRYTLELECYEDTDYRKELIHYALGTSGKISLYLDLAVKPEIHRIYKICRIYGKESTVAELDHSSNAFREVELRPAEIFINGGLPLFFGQREIYEVTHKENHRLHLIDEIIGHEATESLKSLDKIIEELKQNARNYIDLNKRLEEKKEVEHRLEQINHEIELFEREGLLGKLSESLLLSQDDERLKGAVNKLTDVTTSWEHAFNEISAALNSGIAQASQAKSARKDILEKIANELKSSIINFQIAYIQGKDSINQSISNLAQTESEWKESEKHFDAEMERIKQALGQQKLDPNRLDELTREQIRNSTKLVELSGLEKEYQSVQKARTSLLTRLQEIREQIYRLREEQAREITEKLEGRIRIEIDFKYQKSQLVSKLAALMQGSSISRDVVHKICVKEDRIIDGIYIAEVVREGEKAIQNEFGLSDKRASQVLNWLNADENRLFELELLSPDDLVQIFYKIGETELSLDNLSGGQRATAMLLLLLAQDERLLIIDQPEDDLDNRFIYEDIVQVLRNQKGKRQIIVATHNPNIPVLGDAELIIALESEINNLKVSIQGSVDQQRVCDAVKHIMEGGEDAFRRRAEKYGWIEESR